MWYARFVFDLYNVRAVWLSGETTVDETVQCSVAYVHLATAVLREQSIYTLNCVLKLCVELTSALLHRETLSSFKK